MLCLGTKCSLLMFNTQHPTPSEIGIWILRTFGLFRKGTPTVIPAKLVLSVFFLNLEQISEKALPSPLDHLTAPSSVFGIWDFFWSGTYFKNNLLPGHLEPHSWGVFLHLCHQGALFVPFANYFRRK